MHLLSELANLSSHLETSLPFLDVAGFFVQSHDVGVRRAFIEVLKEGLEGVLVALRLAFDLDRWCEGKAKVIEIRGVDG